MNQSESPGPVRIRELLAGRHLLVTGATGFLARAFVEKLLRAVDTVGGIHLLIRPGKDGLSPHDRLKRDLLSTPAFDRLRAARGSAFDSLCREKLHVVPGDLGRPRMGLSTEDYKTVARQINLVVNSAATVTFDERLDWAVDLNTRGPQRLLQFAKDCGDVPFLHVSTCYVCGTRDGVIVEDFSAPESARESLPYDRRTGNFDLDATVNSLEAAVAKTRANVGPDSDAFRGALIAEGMSQARRAGWNDTYTFTKWLGEQLLVRDRGNVPMVILRPAIIEGSLNEPLPGWIDGLRMADPVIVAYGKGRIRDFPGRSDVPIDFIPVDLVANAMIATLPVKESDGNTLSVYQSATSGCCPLTLRDLASSLEQAFRQRPMADDSGRPIVPTPLRFVSVNSFLKTWARKKQRIELGLSLMKKLRALGRRSRRLAAAARQVDQILYFAKIYAPYTHLDVRFADDGLRALHQRLHPADRDEFQFLPDSFDWNDYLVNRHIPGLRSFVLGSAQDPTPRIRAVEATTSLPLISDESLKGDHLFDVFRRAAQLQPNKPALQIRRQGRWMRYSYDEAVRAAGSIALRFEECGLHRGDRVIVWAENGPEWGLTYLAAMRSGFTAVPLDPQLSAQDAIAAARFVDAKLVCASSATAAKWNSVTDSDFRAIPCVVMEPPFVPPPGASQDTLRDAADVSATDIASILFTSGTTIAPRAVPLTHRNLISNAQAMVQTHPILATDEFLSVLPLYHVFEFTAGFVVPLCSGSTITYVEQLKGPEILSAMQETGTTVMMVVPRLLQLFHDSIERQVASAGAVRRGMFATLGILSDLSAGRWARPLFRPVHKKFGGRLRMFVSGGSGLDPVLWHAFRRLGFVVHEGYGLTETAPVLCVTPPGSAKPGSVGPPLPNVEMQIHNAGLDGVGEVWVRGPNVMSGYLQNPEATAEVFTDGWLRTGDLGRFDEVGFLHLTGRTKDLIVTAAGKNVYPDEVELHYRGLPNVKEICAIGMPPKNGAGDEVHAVVVIDMQVVPESDRSSIEREIRRAAERIAETLPTHQRIQTLHFWQRELPKTSTLKAKRGLVREMLIHGESETRLDHPGVPGVPPTPATSPTPVHAALAAVQAILARITRRAPQTIQPETHLMLDLGIDSLGKIDVITAVESHFRISIDDPTAAGISRVSDLLRIIGDGAPLKCESRVESRWTRWFRTNEVLAATNGASNHRSSPLRWLARGGMGLFMHSYVRVQVVGRENIPIEGPFLLAPNHASHLDAPAILTAIAGRRRVWVAAAEDYFYRSRWRRFVMGRCFDAVAFDRQADGVQGLLRCSEILARGDGVLMFPEGTRSLDGRLQPFKIGAAVLAIQRRIPVVPVRIDHAFKLMRKGRRLPRPGTIRVTFLPTLVPPDIVQDADPYPIFHEFARRIERAVATTSVEVGR